MKPAAVYAAVGLAAFAVGGAMWWATQPGRRDPARLEAPSVSPAALYAATFRDDNGASQPLGRFQGRLLVLNFWATWCAPCREEMPAFQRLQTAWAERGVAFVGLSSENPQLARRFAAQHGIGYPLWTGGAEVMELSRRLGNHAGVLPHTAIISPEGRVVAAKVGPYNEAELAAILQETAANVTQRSQTRKSYP